MRRTAAAFGLLLAALHAAPAQAVTLWSDDRIAGGPGLFFGPGSWTQVEKLFPVVIHNMGFSTDADFVTPFRNHGSDGPPTTGEQAFGITDGKTSDGSLINENVDIGVLSIAGTRMLPAIVRGEGKFGGAQAAVSVRNGNVIMVMDLVIDLGIGPRGVIKMPFYGTTGTVTVPYSLQTQQGGKGVDQAGPLASGTTLAGRVGDFMHDGFLSGTLVAAGVMPLASPIYPGQPIVMVRNFETDIAVDGMVFGGYKNSILHREAQ
jgi:hypothetical protein